MTGGPASGLTPGLTLGQGTGEIANSQCRVFAQGSSYAVSGNTLTLVLSMAFTSGFTGNKVIYMAARDVQEAASGWRPMGVARIPEPVVQYPLVGEMTPGAGSGAAPLLSFTFSDSTNVNNLRTVWMLVNSQLNAPLACYLAYSVPQNWLYLFSNAARPGEITSMPMDGNGMIENSQCRVTAAGSHVSRVGNQPRLELQMTFSPFFYGPRVVWGGAETVSGHGSGWKAIGAWMVP
jgi:hypothetical protein